MQGSSPARLQFLPRDPHLSSIPKAMLPWDAPCRSAQLHFSSQRWFPSPLQSLWDHPSAALRNSCPSAAGQQALLCYVELWPEIPPLRPQPPYLLSFYPSQQPTVLKASTFITNQLPTFWWCLGSLCPCRHQTLETHYCSFKLHHLPCFSNCSFGQPPGTGGWSDRIGI